MSERGMFLAVPAHGAHTWLRQFQPMPTAFSTTRAAAVPISCKAFALPLSAECLKDITASPTCA